METNTHAPLKVLLAAPHFPPTRIGGAELFAYRIARGLVARGHVVQVVCAESVDDAASNGALRGSDEVYDGIPVRRLYYNQRALSETRRATFASPLIEAQLGAWLAQNRVDLVHLVSGYLLGIAPLRAARRFGIPTVVTLNDFWFLCPTINFLRGDGSLCAGPSALECARCLYDAQRRFRYVDQRAPQLMRGFWQFAREHPQLGARFDLPQRLEMLDERRAQLRDALNAADVIAPITHFLANRFAAQGFDAARFMVTPLAGPPQIDHAPTRADADEIHFGYLGQIAPIKGVDVLVRAFRQLKRTRRHARLTIYGGMDAHPDYARRVRQLAANDPDITFAGRYENARVVQILAALDAIIVPSTCYENSPTVLLEAFAARRPVIGTNVGGISEIVQPEVNGLLFTRGDANDLARQMQRMLDEPKLLPQLAHGIPPVRTADEEVEQYLDIYARARAARQSIQIPAEGLNVSRVL